MQIITPSAELVQCSADADVMLERIARVCYNSEDRMHCDCADNRCEKCQARRRKFLGGLRDRRHDSVFEHAAATFLLVTDRGITHELVRHRLASYTQSSTRYIKYDAGIPVVPPAFKDKLEEEVWRRAMEAADACYRELIASGVPAEAARDVLPTCTAAKIFVTANFREWRHILTLRLAKGAHPKIRLLSKMIWENLRPHCPAYFDDLAALMPDLLDADPAQQSLKDTVKP